MLRTLTAAAAVVAAAATYGVDISAPLDSNTASCFVSQAGVSFGIVRGWMSYGAFDGNVVGSVANLWAGGAAHVDVYAFPCAGQASVRGLRGASASASHRAACRR